MRVEGSCHCGHVRYEADIDPKAVSICYCNDCQVLTGSAFRVTVPAPHQSVRLTTNRPKTYTKVADNGKRRLQLFCPECGSPLFATGEGVEGEIWSIRWGSIHQRDRLKPRRAEWCRSAPGWIGTLDLLPGSETE